MSKATLRKTAFKGGLLIDGTGNAAVENSLVLVDLSLIHI